MIVASHFRVEGVGQARVNTNLPIYPALKERQSERSEIARTDLSGLIFFFGVINGQRGGRQVAGTSGRSDEAAAAAR